MRTIGIIFEYDGTGFSGWQVQTEEHRTVHGEVRKALETVLQETPVVHCSGRTDAGVHALYQSTHFFTDNPIDLDKLQGGLNSLLPRDVAAISVGEMSEGFHARRSAVNKTYLYRILNRRQRGALERARVWHVTGALDIEAMRRAAACLVGSHDFKSFEGKLSEANSTMRTIMEAGVEIVDQEIHLRLTGNGFLKYMVRNITGTLVEIGLGKRPKGGMPAILDARDRRKAGQTAPPHGLYLERVRYPEPFETELRSKLHPSSRRSG